jgi:general secretion pathway protein H
LSVQSGGFTLIELLVVMLIIGLAMAMVSISVGGDSQARQVKQAAEQLAREIGIELQQTQADGRNRGVVFFSSTAGGWSWRWYQQREQAWVPVVDALSGAEVPTSMHLPGSSTLQLRVEGRSIDFAGRTAEPAHPVPDIVAFASGELTPFSLLFVDQTRSPESRLILCADGFGAVSLQAGQSAECAQVAL